MPETIRVVFDNATPPALWECELPEGNYKITLRLGDKHGSSETMVLAEARRLMLEAVTTRLGQTLTRTIVVNVRRPEITPGKSVRLKPREIGPPLHPNWDDKLSLQFLGNQPRVTSLEIVPTKKIRTVFLLGDSTVTDQIGEEYRAWGQILPCYFQPSVVISNHAESGESLRSTRSSLRFDKVLTQLQQGDYVFLQFGHNDQKEKGDGIGAFGSYKTDLKDFTTKIKTRGGLPVLVTSMYRRRFDAKGTLYDTLGDYPETVRQVAHEENLPLIDLHKMSSLVFQSLGVEGSKKAFIHTATIQDDTHFSTYGATLLARCVALGIRESVPNLARSLWKDLPKFDPKSP
jgi:lysophospholipase L1-like esterase